MTSLREDSPMRLACKFILQSDAWKDALDTSHPSALLLAPSGVCSTWAGGWIKSDCRDALKGMLLVPSIT